MSDRIPFPSRMKRLKSLPVLPTLLTSGNLGCGVCAIIFAFQGEVVFASYLIFIGMLCDMLDGKMARMTNTEGEFGAELDSLADVISFGVAPAMLIHNVVLSESPSWEGAWFITVIYPVFAAIRLARYNVEHGNEAEDRFFKGIPSPGAAALICSWVISYKLFEKEGVLTNENYLPYVHYGLLTGTFFMGLLMVSNIRFPHIGNTILSKRMGFKKFILLFTFIYTLTFTVGWHTLAVLTTSYVLYGFIPGMVFALRKWSAGKSLLDDDDDGFEPNPADSEQTDGDDSDDSRTA
ncbi:MAG: CDP-diacylglycerol--serine O-phosphatidyltransferase [Planctomycetes bacterium]|nr:CDP-diacylglycerol--serine O-phosphatidyltransferase [Planctomycetota bacterium]